MSMFQSCVTDCRCPEQYAWVFRSSPRRPPNMIVCCIWTSITVLLSSHFVRYCIFLFIFVVTVIKPRVSHMLDKHSTTKLCYRPFHILFSNSEPLLRTRRQRQRQRHYEFRDSQRHIVIPGLKRKKKKESLNQSTLKKMGTLYLIFEGKCIKVFVDNFQSYSPVYLVDTSPVSRETRRIG